MSCVVVRLSADWSSEPRWTLIGCKCGIKSKWGVACLCSITFFREFKHLQFFTNTSMERVAHSFLFLPCFEQYLLVLGSATRFCELFLQTTSRDSWHPGLVYYIIICFKTFKRTHILSLCICLSTFSFLFFIKNGVYWNVMCSCSVCCRHYSVNKKNI